MSGSILDELDASLSGGGGAAAGHGTLVTLDGRGYLIEPSLYQRETVAATRPPTDQGAEPSEASYNPDAAWRRIQADWSWGAGQEFFDEPDSDRRRFFDSRRVDVLSVRNALSLLPTTDLKRATPNTGLALLAAGDYLYLADGGTLCLVDGAGTWQTFAVGASILGLATDGTYVYIASSGQALQRSTIGSAAAAAFGAFVAEGVAFANGRLFAWAGATLNEIGAAGAVTLAKTLTFGTWGGVAATPGPIVAWSGGNQLWGFTVDAATGALQAPTVMGEVPRGETVHAVEHYLGWLLVGTSAGFRVCEISSNGIRLGAVVELGAVHAFTTFGRFAWCSWSQRDAGTGAVARIDLGRFTDPDLLVPAYASDLEAPGGGTVAGVAHFDGGVWFSIDGAGLYAEAAALCTSGWVESSKIRWSSYEPKLMASFDFGMDPLVDGSVAAELRVDGGGWVTIAAADTVATTGPAQPYTISSTVGVEAQVRLTLTRGITVGPTLRRAVLRAYPQAVPVDRITVPIHAKFVLLTGSGQGRKTWMDVTTELDRLRALRGAKRAITYVEGGRAEQVLVEGVAFKGEKWDAKRRQLVGLIFVTLKTLEV